MLEIKSVSDAQIGSNQKNKKSKRKMRFEDDQIKMTELALCTETKL